jgi:hypothetical protein
MTQIQNATTTQNNVPRETEMMNTIELVSRLDLLSEFLLGNNVNISVDYLTNPEQEPEMLSFSAHGASALLRILFSQFLHHKTGEMNIDIVYSSASGKKVSIYFKCSESVEITCNLYNSVESSIPVYYFNTLLNPNSNSGKDVFFQILESEIPKEIRDIQTLVRPFLQVCGIKLLKDQ